MQLYWRKRGNDLKFDELLFSFAAFCRCMFCCKLWSGCGLPYSKIYSGIFLFVCVSSSAGSIFPTCTPILWAAERRRIVLNFVFESCHPQHFVHQCCNIVSADFCDPELLEQSLVLNLSPMQLFFFFPVEKNFFKIISSSTSCSSCSLPVVVWSCLDI